MHPSLVSSLAADSLNLIAIPRQSNHIVSASDLAIEFAQIMRLQRSARRSHPCYDLLLLLSVYEHMNILACNRRAVVVIEQAAKIPASEPVRCALVSTPRALVS